jgi:hypothetical protein
MRGQDMNRNIAADNHLLSKIFLIFLIHLESNKFINNNSTLILNNNTKHPCINSKHKVHNWAKTLITRNLHYSRLLILHSRKYSNCQTQIQARYLSKM